MSFRTNSQKVSKWIKTQKIPEDFILTDRRQAQQLADKMQGVELVSASRSRSVPASIFGRKKESGWSLIWGDCDGPHHALNGPIKIYWACEVSTTKQVLIVKPWAFASRASMRGGKGPDMQALLIEALGLETIEIPLPEEAVELPDCPWGGERPEWGAWSEAANPSIYFLSEAKVLVAEFFTQVNEALSGEK